MRKVALIVAALAASPACAADLSGPGAFGGGVYRGYQQGQAQQLEIERLRLCNQLLAMGRYHPMCGGPLAVVPPPIYVEPPPQTYTTCMRITDDFVTCSTR